MKMKNLVAFAMLALGAVAAPFAGHADVEPGDIYSIDLVENGLYGGRIPTKESPLKIGEKAVIRVRLLNREFGQAGTGWRFQFLGAAGGLPESVKKAMFSPDLGLMLGGQPVYASFIECVEDVPTPANTYTDIYFEYEVKSGDLAMPAQLMNTEGKPASSTISLDYRLLNKTSWKITNDAGDEALFHFRPQGTVPEPADPPGEEQNFCVSGVGMGLFIKTIDFDRNYAKEAEMPGETDIWRIFYAGETDTTTIPPSIATEGGGAAERDSIMYVWSDDETVVAPRKIDGAEQVTDTVGGVARTRWVLPVTVAKSKSTVPFTLKAAADAVGKTANIRMSSSRNLIVDDFGVLVTNWVERTVEVTEPPEPYISINFVDPAGNPISSVTAGPDYRQFAAAMIVKLNGKAPTTKTTVKFAIENTAGADVEAKVIPAASADRRIGISTSSDPVDQPWGDRVLSVEFNAGETEKTLYVYALDRTTDIDTKIVFNPYDAALLAPPYASEYTGTAKKGSLAVNGAKPVITAPEEGMAITGAMAGEVYALDVTVASSYRNLNGQKNKWKLFYKSAAFGDNNWKSLTDQSVDSTTGTMTANLTPTVAGKRDLEIYVIDPNGLVSDHVKMTIDVEKAKTAWAELDRADGEYAEGDASSARVKFFISQPSESSSALYAFLRPINADASNCVASAAMTTATPSQGVLIEPGETDSKNRTADIRLLDGRYPKTAAIFEVVICSSLTFDEGNRKSYSPGQVYLDVTNVCPRIESCSIGGIDVTQPGTKVAAPIAQNVNKKFRVSIGNSEPSRADLDGILEEDGTDNRYYTQWKFGSEEWGDGTTPGNVLYGNPNTNVVEHKFFSPGDQLIKVRVQDKDMRARGIWSEEFSFTVTVLDIPKVTITPIQDRKRYYEDETGSDYGFKVELSAAPDVSSGSQRLNVLLTVSLLGDATKYSVEDLTLSVTNVTFAGGVSSGPQFFLKQLDGTAESAGSGFRITAHVTNPEIDTEGKTWDDGEIEVYIDNRDPKIIQPSEKLDKDGNPIASVTTIGTENSLAWSLQDVVADRKKMSVTWETSEGQRTTYTQGDPGWDDVMSGTHTFSFTSAGEKSVTLTVLDKDGGTDSRTFYYTIEASKMLELVPHGPATGNGTPLSSRYHDKASGRGEGWVDADNINTYNSKAWTFGGNCGIETSWRLYAGGYTNGQVDVRSDLGFSYTYLPDDGKDSFLYAWLQIAQEKDAAKPTDIYLSIAPEHRKAGNANSGTLISLPTEKVNTSGADKTGGTYAKTCAEAIFSKEYLVSDNMGDINQDGVPDIYAKKYDFGIYDDAGNATGDDLKQITSENNGNLDEDYLPSTETAQYGALIPALPADWVTLGMPFDARTEIRGYHLGLNDAPAQAGISDVAPDRVYEVDDGTGNMVWDKDKCTISELEHLAWRRYAKRNGLDAANPSDWAKWSPERPTDPTLADTDDDGYPDGYEYFFWYRAHVGYLEGTNLVQLTGRRYNPMHPCEPDRISSEEIAALMDPLVPCDKETANTRDTDNDGLPDMFELELGTNPFDYDTDGDGLPDGYEVYIAKEESDPLKYATNDLDCDADLNVDSDGMAFFSYNTEDTLYWVAPVVCEDGQKGYICSPAGQPFTVVTNIVDELTTNLTVAAVSGSNAVYTAWLYKRGGFAEKREFCRGRTYWCPDTYTNLVLRGEITREVMDIIHFDVYHEFGFDPRTGWNFPIVWVGHLVNGRAFTARDEFLTQAFFYHKGGLGREDLVPTREKPWATLWEQQSTSPESADTDSDGMPDGWELYMMAGAPEPRPEIPSKGADLRPHEECSPRWMYGPLESFEKIANTLAADPDNDGLDWPHEYSGVESCDKYADCPTITLLQPEWQNKWWPTDPWAEDTDGDGLKDGEEGGKFIYGSATHVSPDFEDIVPGGGLNPLSWDTDCDGLPDPWEDEFAGTPKTTPASSETTVSPEGVTNTLLIAASATWNDDGMDGTVHDSMKDYDKDGLANWQEYMVGAMRCWRYDDTVSPWVQHKIPLTSSDHPSDSTLYEILANWEGAKFNPGFKGFHFSPAVYFSCANNAFEQGNGFGGKVYGHFYMFKDGIYHDLKDMVDANGNNRYTRNATLVSPGGAMHSYQDHDSSGKIPIYPQKYICCDPTLSDTDFDGLDDYYELFHGLNPILGESTIRWTSAARPARDIIYEAYYKEKQFENPWSAEYNSWLDSGILFLQTRPDKELQVKDGEKNIHDFFQFPWLAGMAASDPDGDNIRNQQEGIFMNLQAAATYLHTDPTPLWMTDYSYEDSLVCRYYQVGEPTWAKQATLESFLYNKDHFVGPDGTKYPMSRYPWLEPVFEEGDIVAYKINFDDAFNFWKVRDDMYDYEENEGYDTDHDYLSDFEEAQGKTKTASDPQYHDDPLRRQAMWFGGDEDKGFLETTTPDDETTPYTTTGAEVRQNFLYFTVECWAKPDAATMGREELQTLVERAIWVGPANPADENYLRKNFLIGIKGGRWYAKFDTTGTDLNQPVEITDGPEATAEWTHVAATYDGTALRLYVNGICSVLKETRLQPEHGVSAASVDENGEIAPGTHEWADKKGREHLIAVLVGASAASWMGISFDGAWQNRNPAGFSPFPNPLHLLTSHTTKIGDYRNFYRGYIDEVRLWDGARSASDIKRAYETRERYTMKMAIQNRDEVFAAWARGARRTPTAPTALPAQLMNHWSFDHIPGAVEAEDVLPAPAGFSTLKGVTDAMAPWARPDGWTNCWRTAIDESIQSRVYNDLAWVPWINDTVGHMPLLDETTLDSVYWSANYAGAVSAAAAGYSSFAFPRTAEAPSNRRQVIYAEGKGGEGPGDGNPGTPYTTFTRWMTVAGDDALKDAYRFSHRNRLRRGFDLMPFGGAFARRISSAEGGMWDDQGAADAWAQTGGDANNDGLPDWWSQYALENYYEGDPTKPVTWDTTVNYYGISMPAYLAYKRDLAKGLLIDGEYHPEYEDTRDVDADGLPDWWEELYGVQGYAKADADADPDNDALSNYAEYLLGEVYPYAYEGIGNIRLLNPKLMHSVTNQLVTDYFLRYSTEFKDIRNAAGKSVFYLNEYFGEIATDHDFMEDWWENQFAGSYASSRVYDPLDDTDEDGWSNWAECRATLWGGHFDASLIDRWTGSDSSQHIVCYPEPIVGVRATYHGKQKVTGSPLVIRMTTGQTPRTDATFVVPSTLSSQTRYIGPFTADYALHGHLSPGHINGNSIMFERAKVSSDKTYLWNCDYYKENAKDEIGWDGSATWEAAERTHTGSFETYSNELLRWPKIELEGGDLTWELFTQSYESGNFAEIHGNALKLGTVNLTTGEYELDMTKFEGAVGEYVFRVTYTSRIGAEWPQTVYVSDTKEFATGDGASVTGNGRIREGRNTVEAFLDLNGNGAFDEGEPFGSARNVQVGWHKVPEVVIELKDVSPIMPGITVAAAAGGEDAPASAALTKTVKVIRETINGYPAERTLVTKEIVVDDHPYLTELDVSTAAKPDLDWTWLLKDAAKIAAKHEEFATVEKAVYRVDELVTVDGVTFTNTLQSFVKEFPAIRPTATAVSPVGSKDKPTPVYSASPTLAFSVSDAKATGYRLQIRRFGATSPIYDSGISLLPGRGGATVGVAACAVTPPIYANAPVYSGTTTNRAVFADGTNYQWRVALYDAKYNATTDDSDGSSEWSAWANFEMDVCNSNRYPRLPTGYGNATLTVRYYGPNTNDLTGKIVVEAFENADFRGQPLAQLRMSDLADLDSVDDISTPNAVLRGLKPGQVFFRAYVDQNDNGSRDKWESWGYANLVGQGFHALYNPDPLEITVSAADWVVGKKADRVIYIEDCDANKNEMPDCLEPELFPEDVSSDVDETESIDWWEWAEADPDDVTEGDVMAYEEVTMKLVTLWDGKDANVLKSYILCNNQPHPFKNSQPTPDTGMMATNYAFVTAWEYGTLTACGVPVPAEELAGLKVYKTPEDVKVALIHAQVREKNGFCADTAVPGGKTNTKPFTAQDKYYVLRYLEQTGRLAEPVPEGYKSFEDYVMNSGNVKLYEKYCLKPNVIDNDHDGIADGFELYIDSKPLDASDRESDWDDDGVPLWREFELDPDTGLAHATDPRAKDTDGDGITDKDFHDFLLWDAGGDKDGDGLSNYAEYLITRVFKAAQLDPRNPKTDGSCVDYFRKMGELYFGEIFTDHDQVNDVWEGAYEKAANRYAYDPSRDDDGDGWSNWAEAKAGTDPETEADVGIDGYVLAAYPVPCIETFLTCSGAADAAAPVVIKAWSQKTDPNMTGKADAVWHLGNSEEQASVGVNTSQKYVGLKPNGTRSFNLGPGAIQHGSVRIAFKDLSYCVAKLDQYGEIENLSIGDPDDAKWYYMAQDREGVLYTIGGVLAGEQAVGTVDYETGKVTVNFDAEHMNGMMLGDTKSVAEEGDGAEKKTEKEDDSTYDLLNLEQSYVIVTWSSCTTLGSFNRTLYLSDADSSVSSLSGGYVREGLNTFMAFVDLDGGTDGEWDPGEPFGVVRDVDVGWDGAKLRIDLTETSAITPRIDLWDDESDRISTVNEALQASAVNDPLLKTWLTNEEMRVWYAGVLSNRVALVNPPDDGERTRVRVVRYGIDDMFCYRAGVYGQGGGGYEQRAVLDKTFDPDGRDFLCEADFLYDGEFDLDWSYLQSEVVSASGTSQLAISNMTYLVVIGDGPTSFRGSKDTNTTVNALSTMVTRRFEVTRHAPKTVSPKGGYVFSARPTFRWAIPDEEPWAKAYGTSYTAFKLQILREDGKTVVYDSGVRRLPPQAKDGSFEWTADAFAGDQLPVGNYTWRVAMYNAKFKPLASRDEKWSDTGKFSIATGTQQETDDHNYSSVDVSVKYTGPALVLSAAGFVRVQAFETADFSGTPAAQIRITDMNSVKDATDIRKNGTLIGLKSGTYYIRAYIDSNKNGVKDDWESWGAAKEPVVVKLNQLAPITGFYIEDADTDQDWLPDAWEMAKYGDLSKEGAEVDPAGRIVLKTETFEAFETGTANISRFLSGASLTFFQNLGNVSLALGLDDVTEKSIAEIRAMVEKNIDPNTVKITSLVVDPGNGTNGKVILTVAAKATDSIAGYLLSPVYELPKSTDVMIKVYRKANLATEGWGEPLLNPETGERFWKVTITETLEQRVEVPITGVDFNSGFYKVEIVQ